jgi:hypothetical protein
MRWISARSCGGFAASGRLIGFGWAMIVIPEWGSVAAPGRNSRPPTVKAL